MSLAWPRTRMSSRTFSCVTLGCKVNQYETQAIREALAAAGWHEVPFGAPCDVAVVNTCTVTARARRKSRKAIHRARGERVVVTGCLAEIEPVPPAGPGRDVVAVPKDRAARLPELLEADAGKPAHADPHGDATAEASVFDLRIGDFEGRSRAFLKVQDGCDHFCAYCIVPYARGRPRSRPRADIRREAERLVAAGFREIVLCGIHLGLYGRDAPDTSPARLEDVIEDLLEVPGLERLRLSSIEANEVSDRLIEMMAGSDVLCPHLHVPLQSGDDEVLRRMNRRYTVAEFLDRLDRVRARVPEPSFTTDVLAGFPGETEAQFENTLHVCRRAEFSRLHVFSYSPRPGTAAAALRPRVPSREIARRVKRAEGLGAELARTYRERFVGRTLHPLVEHRRDRATGLLCGYTERYVRVLVEGPDALMGRIVAVRAAGLPGGTLRGEALEKPPASRCAGGAARAG